MATQGATARRGRVCGRSSERTEVHCFGGLGPVVVSTSTLFNQPRQDSRRMSSAACSMWFRTALARTLARALLHRLTCPGRIMACIHELLTMSRRQVHTSLIAVLSSQHYEASTAWYLLLCLQSTAAALPEAARYLSSCAASCWTSTAKVRSCAKCAACV